MLFNKEMRNTTKYVKKICAFIKKLIDKISLDREEAYSLDKKMLTLSNARKFITSAAAVVIVFVLGCGTFGANGICFGSEAIIGGKTVALIDDVDEFEKTLTYAENFVYAVSDQEVDYAVTYVPRVIRRASLTSEYDILQNLYAQSNGMTYGCALYVDGEFVAATGNKDVANEALQSLKDRYHSEKVENLTVSFDKNVELREEYVPVQAIMSAESVSAILTGDRTHYGYYTVEKGDTLSSVAAKLDVRESEIKGINGDSLKVGAVIPYKHKDTILKVKAEYTQTATVAVPYETERVSSNDIKKGRAQVKTRGVDGEKLVTYKTVIINGVETASVVVSEKITTPAKNEVILIGCGKASDGKTIVASAEGSTGYFLWPNRGKVSSVFGNRSRDNHKGVDICSPVGTDIYASDGGTVTFAGWNDGGFGYMVIIDHGNGYETYYAHCDKVLVSEGQTVDQGQLIALVGNTGLSTGPHLHFEVRRNGTPVNPLNYMDV